MHLLIVAFAAHYKVLKRAGILHRDISVGNIMIRVDGAKRMGFLIDWDLSRLESELGNGPVEPDRTVCPLNYRWGLSTQLCTGHLAIPLGSIPQVP